MMSLDFSILKVSPHENMSTAAYKYSGQVCIDMCDSAIETIPVTPTGLNLWNDSPTIVAPDSIADIIRKSFI